MQIWIIQIVRNYALNLSVSMFRKELWPYRLEDILMWQEIVKGREAKSVPNSVHFCGTRQNSLNQFLR